MEYKNSHIDIDKMNFFTDKTKQRPIINLILQFGVQTAGRYVPIKHTKAQQMSRDIFTMPHSRLLLF